MGESSEDDDIWIGMEFDNHQMGIPRMEEKEVQKEVGQRSLEKPLDTPTLPLECAHGVEEEHPLLKIMPVTSLVDENCYPIDVEEKHVIHNNDVVYVDETDSEMNEEEEVIELFLGSIENVCKIKDKKSNQEEFPIVRSTQEDVQPKVVAKLMYEPYTQMLKSENQGEEFSANMFIQEEYGGRRPESVIVHNTMFVADNSYGYISGAAGIAEGVYRC